MADVKFEDYSAKVIGNLNDTTIAFLYEAGDELTSKVASKTRVDTGQLKSSWDYNVDESNGECTIGSPLENAIWEEFGTGQYALNGDGRKTPWVYTDRHGNQVFTHGKHPQRTLYNTFTSMQEKIKRALESKLKGMN